MSENILLKNIGSIDSFFALPKQIDQLEKDILVYQQTDLVYQNSITMGVADDTIFGKGISSATSNAEAKSILDDTFTAESIANADANAFAIGIVNLCDAGIYTGKGNDIILGVADVSATSTANAQAGLALENIYFTDVTSNSLARVNIAVNAVGINNSGYISTATGNDVIVGVAKASSVGKASAQSEAESVLSTDSLVGANSEATVIVENLAIGIDNIGQINTGRGDDIIIGLANATATSEAVASALTFNTTVLATGDDAQVIDELTTAIALSTSTAIAVSTTTSLGIINSGQIITMTGNDVIVGIANNLTSSRSQAQSVAESLATEIGIATADAQSLAIAQGSAVGIVNLGEINTDIGNDTVIGIAIDQPAAVAAADANAASAVGDTNAQTNTDAIADTSEAIAIGIDNTGGRILTGKDKDQVIGVGEIGILGGKINTGNGVDRVLGYGSVVGVEDSLIRLGQGDDFFQAAIVSFDPTTGAITFSADQSNSLKNAHLFGDVGNDTFEIGGFEGKVLIDGGKDFDSLRLSGNLQDYNITLLDSTTLTIEDSGSILTVQNIEALYSGDSNQAYAISNFA